MINLQEVIICDLKTKGTGQHVSSPIRRIIEIYSKEGVLIALNDPMGNFTKEDLFEFARQCQLRPTEDIEKIFQSWGYVGD